MNILALIFPVIAVTAIGYALARSEFVNKSQLDGLSKITFNILMPSFLFVTMATSNLAEQFEPDIMFAFYLPVLGFYITLMAYHYYFAKTDRKQLGTAAVYAMGNTYSNVVLLGLPVVLSALGPDYATYVFLILSAHGIIMIGFTNFCGAFNQSSKTANTSKLSSTIKNLWHMISNPVLASIIGGMLYNVLGLGLNDTIKDTLTLLGKPGITCALIILGSSLHFYAIKGHRLQIAWLSLVKLILLPLSVYLSATYLFELEKTLVAVVVILSASPTGVNAYLVACTVQKHQALVASTVVVTTVLCMFSMIGWLWLLL